MLGHVNFILYVYFSPIVAQCEHSGWWNMGFQYMSLERVTGELLTQHDEIGLGADGAQLVDDVTAVGGGVRHLGVLYDQRRLVIPEEHLVLPAAEQLLGLLEPENGNRHLILDININNITI